MAKELKRLWELDFLRGIAIILVIAFHAFYDLKNYFGFTEWQYDQGFWYWERRAAGGLFVLLAGVLTAVIAKEKTFSEVFQKNLRRGLRLIGLGLLITGVTLMVMPAWTVWFGILHFLGIAILFSTFFIRLRWANLGLGFLALILGNFLKGLTVSHWFGLMFGVRPLGFQSLDYYPLFPWFGVTLIGLGFGNLIYENRMALMKRPPFWFEHPLNWLGKYSLWIYLVHQPILLGILWLIFK